MIQNTNKKAQFHYNYIIIIPQIYLEQTSTQAYLRNLDKKKTKIFLKEVETLLEEVTVYIIGNSLPQAHPKHTHNKATQPLYLS